MTPLRRNGAFNIPTYLIQFRERPAIAVPGLGITRLSRNNLSRVNINQTDGIIPKDLYISPSHSQGALLYSPVYKPEAEWAIGVSG